MASSTSLECEVYQEHLCRLRNGVPLYYPQPARGDYHVHVGDVGYIENGQFNTVFNAFANSEETRAMNREFGTPDEFAPLSPDHLEIIEREAYAPRSVIKTSDMLPAGSDIVSDLW